MNDCAKRNDWREIVLNSGTNMAFSSDPASSFESEINEHIAVIDSLKNQFLVLQKIAQQMQYAICSGHKVFWCGNGGSAADSQHLAAELMGRFRRERGSLPSIALTTDTSIVTAVANDYGYDSVFQRQVEALCSAGDVLVGISTSGTSKNVYAAMQTARTMGACTVAFSGQTGGSIATVADFALCVPSKNTARIQEAHILCGHIICEWIDRFICERRK